LYIGKTGHGRAIRSSSVASWLRESKLTNMPKLGFLRNKTKFMFTGIFANHVKPFPHRAGMRSRFLVKGNRRKFFVNQKT